MNVRRPPFEVVGFYVDALRDLRARGATPFELLSFWDSRRLGMFQAYFGAAFDANVPGEQWFRNRATGEWDESKIEAALGEMLQGESDAWRTASPYPDLMRLRDREAFRQVAIQHACIIGVRASNPYAGPLVGTPGFRVRPVEVLAHARMTPPHAGCVAIDPGDPEMRAILKRAKPRRSLADHVRNLEQSGYSVGTAQEGFVVRDASGNLLHPFYELEGVWAKATSVSLWNPIQGPAVQRALNMRLGADLVPLGPSSAWEHRSTPAAIGPNPTVLWFHPDGHASDSQTVGDIAGVYKYYGFKWPYP